MRPLVPDVVRRKTTRPKRRIRFADIRPVYESAAIDEVTSVVTPVVQLPIATRNQPSFYKANVRLSYGVSKGSIGEVPSPKPATRRQSPSQTLTCSPSSSPPSPCPPSSTCSPSSPRSPLAIFTPAVPSSPTSQCSPASPCSPLPPIRTVRTLTNSELRARVDDAVETALLRDLSRSLNAQEREATRPPRCKVYPVLRNRIARRRARPQPQASRASGVGILLQWFVLLISIVVSAVIARAVLDEPPTVGRQLVLSRTSSAIMNLQRPAPVSAMVPAAKRFVRLRIWMDVYVDADSNRGKALLAQQTTDRSLGPQYAVQKLEGANASLVKSLPYVHAVRSSIDSRCAAPAGIDKIFSKSRHSLIAQ